MSTADIIIGFIIGILALGAIYLIGYGIYRVILTEYAYTEVASSEGVVTDMDYEPPRSSYNAATKSTTRTPEKHWVYFKTDQAATKIDSERLYQMVRLDDKIQVKYQERYSKPRFWEGSWKLDGHRLVSITNEKNRELQFNDPKPVIYRGRR